MFYDATAACGPPFRFQVCIHTDGPHGRSDRRRRPADAAIVREMRPDAGWAARGRRSAPHFAEPSRRAPRGARFARRPACGFAQRIGASQISACRRARRERQRFGRVTMILMIRRRFIACDARPVDARRGIASLGRGRDHWRSAPASHAGFGRCDPASSCRTPPAREVRSAAKGLSNTGRGAARATRKTPERRAAREARHAWRRPGVDAPRRPAGAAQQQRDMPPP